MATIYELGKQREADTALLAHCRNNCTKALEALKQEHEYANKAASDAYGITHGAHKCVTCELIKELEIVHINKATGNR